MIAAYSSYGNHIVLEKGDGLAVHHDKERGVVILEYQVHGKAVKTGAAYDNRFVSIVTIKNRKIVRWRDYMAPLPHGRRSTANENGVEVEEPRKAPLHTGSIPVRTSGQGGRSAWSAASCRVFAVSVHAYRLEAPAQLAQT